MGTKKRITNVKETIDAESGEVKTIQNSFTISTSESYGFYRMTNGIDWVKNIGSGKDMKVLFFMLYNQNIHTHEVAFSVAQIADCALFCNVKDRVIVDCVKNLIKQGFILETKKKTYRINPYCFYIGGTNAFIERAKSWDELKKQSNGNN
jgi:hypothetical protein